MAAFSLQAPLISWHARAARRPAVPSVLSPIRRETLRPSGDALSTWTVSDAKQPLYGRRQSAETDTAEPVGLEEKLTDISGKARKGLATHWKWLAGIAIALIVVIGAFQAINAVAESRKDQRSATLHELSIAEEPDFEKIQSFLAEAKGSEIEKPAYRLLVQNLLDRAMKLEKGADFFASFRMTGAPPAEKTEAEQAADDEKRRGYLEKAAEIAKSGIERFGAEGEFGKWASRVEQRVRADSNDDWKPEKRTFKLRLPADKSPTGE